MNVIDKYILIGNNNALVIYDHNSMKKMYLKIRDAEILNVSSCKSNILVEGQNMIRVYQFY